MQQRRTVVFMAGLLVVALGEMSPVAVFSQDLLWVHMVQHLMITIIAGPLLAAGAPASTIRYALSSQTRHLFARISRRAGRWRRTVGAPPPLVLATVVHAATLWVWHVPVIYDAAVVNPALHLVEHAAMLGSAVWFWSQVWATARRHRSAQAQATLCLAATIMQGGVLGALLVFAGRPLYAVYTGAAGFTALEDQQLAGGVMWVPPAFVYAFVAARRFVGWMHAAERDARRRDLDPPIGTTIDHH